MTYGVIGARAGRSGSGWQTLKVGAGGQLSNIDVASDGTMVVRADTYGCYHWDAALPSPGNAGGTGVWTQLVTKQSLPNLSVYRNAAGGGWEIRVAPSLTTRFYMVHGGDSNIYRSDDRGVTWTQCGTLPGAPYPVSANDSTAKFLGYKMAVDPNNADKVIVATPMNGLFVTTNAGSTWTAVATVAFGLAFANVGTSTTSNAISAGSKTFSGLPAWYWYPGQQFLAWQTSNPLNQLQCVVTSATGTNTSVTFTVASTALHGSGSGITDWTIGYTNNAGENGGNCIVFVDSSTVYASAYGIGVYKSTDGGATWSLLNSANMPTHPSKLRIDGNGLLYVVEWSSNTLWKYASSTWTKLGGGALDGYVYAFVAINPSNANQIFTGDSGSWFYSSDAGATWSGRMSGPGSRTATDVPWLANVVPFTISNMVWGADNIVYASDGIGVWKIAPADIVTAAAGFSHPLVTSKSVGIEQLVSQWIISPPSGNPLCSFMDRAIYTISDQTKYPTDHGIIPSSTYDITQGYSADWASNDPTEIFVLTGRGFVVYGTVEIGKSTTGGGTVGGPSDWTVINPPTSPATGGLFSAGGCLAAASTNNIVYVMANGVAGDSGNGNPWGGYVFYTINGGTSWAESAVSGLTRSPDFYLFGANYSLRREIVIADRVNIGTFYMYNSGSVAPGFYRSTNSGANFALLTNGGGNIGTTDAFSAQLRAVPPYSGYTGGAFYATCGINDDDTVVTNSFYECVDVSGTLTKTAVPGVKNVWSFGFGKPKPNGSGYPTIFIRGSVDSAHDVASVGGYGIWRTDDHYVTWTKLSDVYVHNILDQTNVVEGDANTYGKCYVGYAGSGVAAYIP